MKADEERAHCERVAIALNDLAADYDGYEFVAMCTDHVLRERAAARAEGEAKRYQDVQTLAEVGQRYLNDRDLMSDAHEAAELRIVEIKNELQALREVAEKAMSDLECGQHQCWCFTRAAMKERPPCECANCLVWRAFDAVVPR